MTGSLGQALYLVPPLVFLIGLYGVVTSRHLVHLVTCLGVAQSSTSLLLLEIGYRRAGAAPVVHTRAEARRVVDPVVQAMTLTDIVVGAVVTALLLSLAIQAQKRFGTLDPDQLSALRG